MRDNLNHINFTMNEINEVSDEIYEALFEEDNAAEVNKLADKMIQLMKYLKDTVS